MADLFGWILDTFLKLLPTGSDVYLVASFIISLFYFLAVVYGNTRLTAPYFIEWVRILLNGFLIFIFAILLVIINHSLTSEFLPLNLIDGYVQIFVLGSILFPFARIVLKTSPTKEIVFKMGYILSLAALALTLVLDFGAFGGQLIRAALGWTPTYSAYIPATGLLCFVLAFLGVSCTFFFTRLERTFLKPEERDLSRAIEHPARLLAGLIGVILILSFIFAAFIYNDYAISEGTPTYVAQGYLGYYPNYPGSLEKVVNVSLHKKYFFKTPFEACEGWDITGDVSNSSIRYINSTQENFTVTCTKRLENMNATLTLGFCSNADNYTTCPFKVEIADVPFRFGGWVPIHNFQSENRSCSRLEVKGNDSLGRIIDVTEDLDNDYITVAPGDSIAALRIVYYGRSGQLVLEAFRTSTPATFNLSVTCYH
jgi:hypothetical protein